MHRLAGCLLVMVGCGRLGFDALDVPADADLSRPVLEVSPPAFSTASAQFVEVPGATLVVPASPGQKWLFFASAALISTTFGYSTPEVRYLVNGVVEGAGGSEAVQPDRPGPWQHVYVLDGGDEPTVITFEVRDTDGGTTTLSNLHASVVAVPAGSELLYAADDPPKTVTSATMTDLVQLGLTPAAPGQFLVLLLFNQSESPGTSDVVSQWLDPLSMPLGRTFKNPRGAAQSVLLAKIVTLNGPSTITLQSSSGETSTVQYVRAIALRALPSLEVVDEAMPQMTTQAAPLTVSTLTPLSPPMAGRYFVFGTSQVDDDCGNSERAARRVEFVVDAARYSYEHASGNCATELTYGYAGYVPGRPMQLRVDMSSANGQLVVHRESALFTFSAP